MPSNPRNTLQEIVITFEDLVTRKEIMGPLPAGYADFTWSESAWFVARQFLSLVRPEGRIALLNAYGADISMEGESSFDFRGSYMASVWADKANVLVEGWEKGARKYSRTVIAERAITSWQAFDYSGIDRLEFKPNGIHIAIDKITLGVYRAAMGTSDKNDGRAV